MFKSLAVSPPGVSAKPVAVTGCLCEDAQEITSMGANLT